MFAFNVPFLFFLTLACRALAGQASTGRKWVNSGQSITIHCSDPESTARTQTSRSLWVGLHKREQVYNLDQTGLITVQKKFEHRLETDVGLTELTITINDLTVEDTGAYWCMYTRVIKDDDFETQEGNGSILLVVNGRGCDGTDHGFPMNWVLYATIAGTVVLLTVILLLFWIIPKIKAWKATVKPDRPKTSDVYEEMRATLRK